uniref:Arm DNA-binding domain-containing protein n=1 Tax=Alistipes shahii TaxID=328814 RepID=UPI003FEFF69B
MKANIEVICYKYKPLKDGTLPLMLRVTKDRKRKYVSLGLSLQEKFWDFEKGKPKRNCPNKEQIERLIAAKTAEYKKARTPKSSGLVFAPKSHNL